MREALVRSTAIKGLKDPRIAMALLNMDALARASTSGRHAPQELAEEEEALLSRFLEREVRRRQGVIAPSRMSSDDMDDEAEE